jgi:catechol 2,3-dioxygenase-like lactoylglutathione lyase family enzyme
MLHVASIERSIAFYERLGFELVDTDRCEPIGWARLHCEGGALMLLRAEEPLLPFEPGKVPVLFVLYSPDLAGLRAELLAQGVTVSAIKRPDYMPSGTMHLSDPDGFSIEICHWGDAEHAAWLERIGRAPQSAG